MPASQREIRSPITPQEYVESNEVHDLALRKGVLPARKHVRIVVRCNQPTRSYAACDWSRGTEAMAIDAMERARIILRAHLTSEHPSLNSAERERIIGATLSFMRDA